MKIITILILLCVFCFGCANSEVNSDDKNSGETRVYSNKVSFDGGFFNFVSKKDTQKNPLIKNSKFCSIDDIVFIPDYIEDERFISCEEYYNSGDERYLRMPSGNYLTYPDGTKEKICMDDYCRNHPEEYCSHLNLMGGKVDGNYVYYMGKYNNGRKTKTDDSFTSLDYSNYLMRYDLVENVSEVVMELPYYAGIVLSANGCLYIDVNVLADAAESLNHRKTSTVIYDKRNIRAAEVDFNCVDFYDGVAMDEWIYYIKCKEVRYIKKYEVHRIKYDLSENEVLDVGDREYFYSGCSNMLGVAKNKVFCTKYAVASANYNVVSFDKNGKLREVLSGVDGAILADDSLFCVEGDKVMKYSLEFRGRVIGEGEVVFSEAQSCKPGEHINKIEKYGDTAAVHTTCGTENYSRKFIITENGSVLDGEGSTVDYVE